METIIYPLVVVAVGAVAGVDFSCSTAAGDEPTPLAGGGAFSTDVVSQSFIVIWWCLLGFYCYLLAGRFATTVRQVYKFPDRTTANQHTTTLHCIAHFTGNFTTSVEPTEEQQSFWLSIISTSHAQQVRTNRPTRQPYAAAYTVVKDKRVEAVEEAVQ